MAGERLTFTLFLKISESQGEQVKYFPYLETGELLDAKWLIPLQKMNITYLYFIRQDLEGVLAYLNNHLQLLETGGPEQTRTKLNVLREHLNLTIHQAFAAPRLGRHIRGAQQQLDVVIQEFQKDLVSLRMVWDILSRSYSLYNHSVNVCLLATAMMVFLKKSTKDSRMMGFAALFHDLGMTRVPEEILYKSGELTPAEIEETKEHPTTSMQMLKSYAAVPLEAARLVWEHHEDASGSGYPRGLSLMKQHPWTRILRLIDAYDALTTYRLHRPPLTPFAALKHLQEQEGAKGPVFDPLVLKTFIRFLALS
jgi:HD-GYP domain-containing protein (c-di-GMP phosphodiesterase class II)